jgi:hypothetical protein
MSDEDKTGKEISKAEALAVLAEIAEVGRKFKEKFKEEEAAED